MAKGAKTKINVHKKSTSEAVTESLLKNREKKCERCYLQSHVREAE